MSRARLLAIAVGFWSAIAFLFAVQGSARGAPAPFSRALLGALASFAPCMLLTPPMAMLAVRYNFAAQRGRSMIAHASGMTGFVLIGGAMMGAFEWLLPWERGGEGITHAAFVAIGRYVAFDVLTYVLVVSAVMAFAYSREAYERSVTAATLQGQLAEARLHVLSAQLQPHFLFNTLNAISALVREDPPQAERLLARLSDLLRHSLRDNTHPETSVENELSFLEKYVEVQEARFGPGLKVTFQVDPRVLDAKVPRLILQPLVENAIRHGIAPRGGPGSIDVVAEQEGNHVRLSVSDDGVGMPAAGIQEGIGLRTTHERLRQLYGDDHEFAMVSRPHGGLACTVVLPLRRTQSHAS